MLLKTYLIHFIVQLYFFTEKPTIDTNSMNVLNSVGEIICSVTYMMPEDVEGTHALSLRLTLHGKRQNGDISEPEFGQKLIVSEKEVDSHSCVILSLLYTMKQNQLRNSQSTC